MRIEIKYLNFEMCQVLVLDVPKEGTLLVCSKSMADQEVIFGRFEFSEKDFHISIPIGSDRLEELEKLIFYECNGESKRLITHKLNLARWLLSRQILHANVYRSKPKTVKRIAAVTIAYNEDFVLPKWVDYYGRQVGLENIYVIDDGSDINPREYLPATVNVVHQPRTSFDSWRLSRSLGIFQHFLLETYDVVIVTDSDEFIVVSDQQYACLGDFLFKMDIELPRRLVPTGWDLIHLRSSDAPIDLELPIVKQRNALLRNTALDKVAILSDYVSFTPGQHQCYEKTEKAGSLDLIHLRYFDYEFSCKKLEKYRATEWAANDLSTGLSYHQRQEFISLDNEFSGFENKYNSADNLANQNVLNDFWIKQLNV